MKKIIFFIAIAIPLIIPRVIIAQDQSQSPSYFEGAWMKPSFYEGMKKYQNVSIEGKTISHKDVIESSKLVNLFEPLPVKEGFSLAKKMIKAPSVYDMSKTLPNVISTEEGTIIIMWSKSKVGWHLYFDTSPLVTMPVGARVFFFEETAKEFKSSNQNKVNSKTSFNPEKKTGKQTKQKQKKKK